LLRPAFAGYQTQAKMIDPVVLDGLWSTRNALVKMIEVGLNKSYANRVMGEAIFFVGNCASTESSTKAGSDPKVPWKNPAKNFVMITRSL